MDHKNSHGKISWHTANEWTWNAGNRAIYPVAMTKNVYIIVAMGFASTQVSFFSIIEIVEAISLPKQKLKVLAVLVRFV